MTFLIAPISVLTPVAVSFCVAKTAFIDPLLSADRISLNVSIGTPDPHSHSTTWTFNPIRSHMSIQRWENCPNLAARTLSPGLSVLVTAASQAPVPDAGKIKT